MTKRKICWMATRKSHLEKTIPEKIIRWQNEAKKYLFWEKWGNCVRRAWDAWEMGQLRDSHAECVTVGRSACLKTPLILTKLLRYERFGTNFKLSLLFIVAYQNWKYILWLGIKPGTSRMEKKTNVTLNHLLCNHLLCTIHVDEWWLKNHWIWWKRCGIPISLTIT